MELRAFGIEMEIRFRVLPNSFWDSIRFVTDRCHHSGNNAILVMNLKRSLDTRRTACLIVQQWLLELLAGGLSANPMRWVVSRRLFPGKTNYRFCNSFWHSLCFKPRRVFEPLGQFLSPPVQCEVLRAGPGPQPALALGGDALRCGGFPDASGTVGEDVIGAAVPELHQFRLPGSGAPGHRERPSGQGDAGLPGAGAGPPEFG